jgi:hypothetical protein
MARKKAKPVPSPSGDSSPRTVSLLALEALARYTESDLAGPKERMHKDLAVRLAQVASKNEW